MENERILKVEELEAKRINIVDSNGTLRMAIFNKETMPEPLIGGKPLTFNAEPVKRNVSPGIAGITFFNEAGDECGGLVYQNEGAALLFDQHKQDQIIGMTYGEHQGKRQYGLNIWDRPEVPLNDWIKTVMPVLNMEDGPDKQNALQSLQQQGMMGAHRLVAGREHDGSVSVSLSDKQGKPRLRMKVDNEDNPYIEFLNSRGEVVYRLPPDGVSLD